VAVVVVALLGVVALVVVVAAVVGIRRSRRRGTAVPAPIASAADGDLWNAAGISGATGHAWMAGDRAARARAVTDAARRGPRD
jgi:hypothetical protein